MERLRFWEKVKIFREKSTLDVGWINGGFFIFESEIFKYLKSDKTILEKEPLTNLGKQKLNAYKHFGFWYCMDTIRDKEIIEKSKNYNFEKNILIVGGSGFLGLNLIEYLYKSSKYNLILYFKRN